jgi:hypothetical protein
VVASGHIGGLPKYVNNAPEVKDNSSFILDLTHHPYLDHMEPRIARLTMLKLSGNDLTLIWFKRRIQPTEFHDRLMCKYTYVNDKLRVTNFHAYSLNKRIRTIYKVPGGRPLMRLAATSIPNMNVLTVIHFQQSYFI